MDKEKNTKNPPALERGLDILSFLAESNEYDFSIKEIAESLQLPYASVYRIVKCLLEKGFVSEALTVKDRYHIGYKIIAIGKQCMGRMDFMSASLPHLVSIANEVKQTCKISVLSKDSVVTLDQVFPQNGLAHVSDVGKERCIAASASGKVMVSYLPQIKRMPYYDKIKNGENEKNAEKFPTFEIFNAELDKIKEQGYVVSLNEFPGVSCLAVPLFDYSNKPVAGMTVSGPCSDYESETVRNHMLKVLMDARKDISLKLGCTDLNLISGI